MNSYYEAIRKCIVGGDDSTIGGFTMNALEDGASPANIIENALIPGMDSVGERFSRQEAFLPELLIAADAMKASLEILRPLLSREDSRGHGRVVIGTVLGDVHDIGKNIVGWMLEGAGFQVLDLGVDVPPDRFISSIRQESPDILALSALLTTSAPQMGVVIDQIRTSGLREGIKILVGGAAVTSSYALSVGADGYAVDAVEAVRVARSLVSE